MRISAAQGPEITQMKGWLTDWGQAMPDHSGMAGMDDAPSGGMMSGSDMGMLEKATGKQFDEAFLTGMLAHHRLLHEIFAVPSHRSPEDCVESYVSLFLDGIQAGAPAGRKARA